MIPVTWPQPAQASIPRIVHQIWVGPPPPAWVQHYWAIWDDFAKENDLEIMRHTDANPDSMLSSRAMSRMKTLPPVQYANFARLEVVAQHGGAYMDSDTIPLKPLDAWFGVRPAWLGQGVPWVEGTPNFNNATFGFPREHPFLRAVWDEGVRALGRGITTTPFIAGPRAFGSVYRRLGRQLEVTVPHGSFYAFSTADAEKEARRGKPYTPAELAHDHPDADVVHLTMRYWRPPTHTNTTRWGLHDVQP